MIDHWGVLRRLHLHWPKRAASSEWKRFLFPQFSNQWWVKWTILQPEMKLVWFHWVARSSELPWHKRTPLTLPTSLNSITIKHPVHPFLGFQMHCQSICCQFPSPQPPSHSAHHGDGFWLPLKRSSLIILKCSLKQHQSLWNSQHGQSLLQHLDWARESCLWIVWLFTGHLAFSWAMVQSENTLGPNWDHSIFSLFPSVFALLNCSCWPSSPIAVTMLNGHHTFVVVSCFNNEIRSFHVQKTKLMSNWFVVPGLNQQISSSCTNGAICDSKLSEVRAGSFTMWYISMPFFQERKFLVFPIIAWGFVGICFLWLATSAQSEIVACGSIKAHSFSNYSTL